MNEVTVTIDFGVAKRQSLEAVVTVPEKSTVLEVLSARFAVTTAPKYGMDHFIEAIDGVRNDFVNDCGWRFEVNGRSSNVPAERYLVKHGDWIKWSYVGGGCK
jgi:hypothetical protein